MAAFFVRWPHENNTQSHDSGAYWKMWDALHDSLNLVISAMQPPLDSKHGLFSPRLQTMWTPPSIRRPVIVVTDQQPNWSAGGRAIAGAVIFWVVASFFVGICRPLKEFPREAGIQAILTDFPAEERALALLQQYDHAQYTSWGSRASLFL